ncbi:malonyl-CoA decarboxylase [Bradyrhizobium jicamae]|uniref:malonyl-CoA decarboxylase n=1 Tax=Bradyrhizobium jicamae TaxID=280332 RepID=UPI001BADD311|nr:malonyl-CoA decarboxylase [Bradyrhizobium jicamae]MBR0753070.1 malonyl-CoA decarboxylase [Bradyrhizobium jicamae]
MTGIVLKDMFARIAERGRALVEKRSLRLAAFAARAAATAPEAERIEDLCRALLSERGEASGVALAGKVLDRYAMMSGEQKKDFFHALAQDFGPDQLRLKQAWAAYEQTSDTEGLRGLIRAVEPPRQELFRRLNLAPGGTGALVALREDLIKLGDNDPALACVEDDLVHLFYSWFNRGFLVMQRITWSTPADILERIIRYEAVHTIKGWDDLRSRLQPPDRRCYAFFHPSLIDEPLIFVEVALTSGIPGSIQDILAEDRTTLLPEHATTAVFYSISNCQAGLKGVSFGNFLIKQVVQDISRDVPSLKNFVTLSPAPGFARWLKRVAADPKAAGLANVDASALAPLKEKDWHLDPALRSALRPIILNLAAFYYVHAKTSSGKPVDPVARFHLGNGARLERLNWLGDTSPKGLREAEGLMVNYLYDLRFIEENHEAFANSGTVVASDAIKTHLLALAPDLVISENRRV